MGEIDLKWKLGKGTYMKCKGAPDDGDQSNAYKK